MITCNSYGKINLYLDVLDKRADGYHSLEMIMQKISLHDVITIEKANEIKITCTNPKIPTNSDNIVHKAVSLLSQDFPQVTGAHIHIEKNIPVEAGLAGGSSNGAAVIIGMSQLYHLGLKLEDMCKYGEQLGSDVNFFFYGPTCHVSGRGEIIKELPKLPEIQVVLLKPSQGLSAGAVYKNLRLDEDESVSGQKPIKIKEFIEAVACEDIPFILNNLYNKLEESSFELLPQLKEIKEKMILENPYSLMSGSGTTFFSLFTEKEKTENVINKFRDQFDFVAEVTFLK